MTNEPGAYGAETDIIDYILGITYEIWEERRIGLIEQYYGPKTVVYSLDGIVRGCDPVVAGTKAMLDAYPDRQLQGDDVIWSGNADSGFYSSHRITSPMTNLGDTPLGPATGRHVRILTIADCVVEEGVITWEWLMRDNHALVTQLGFDPLDAARLISDNRDDEANDWIAAEIGRVAKADAGTAADAPWSEFASNVLRAHCLRPDAAVLERAYAPYAVMHRSPIEWYSGRDAIADHYAALRASFDIDGASIDHVAVVTRGERDADVAIRWTVSGKHVGDYLGLAPSAKPVFILASSHWRIVQGRIVREWTVFDGNGVLSQLV